jgi:SGT1 protein
VRFTRLQYAKLAYQNFHIPKKFHGASRIIGGTECRKMTQSFDMGCRLMCGFEAMYQREKSEIASNAKSRVKNQKEINLKHKIESKVYYSSKHKKECNLCTVIDSILENRNADGTDTTKDKKNINDGNESSVEMKKSRDLLEAFKRICKETPEDSDSWMYLTPEELDLEMESRVKKIQKENVNSASVTDKASIITIPLTSKIREGSVKNGANDKKKNEDKNIEENPSSDQLMKMLEGMKAFLGTKSGPEGIEDALKSVTKSKTVKSSMAKKTEISGSSNLKSMKENENGNILRVKESVVSDPNNNNTAGNNCINTKDNDDDDEPLEFDLDKLQDILRNFGENDINNTQK